MDTSNPFKWRHFQAEIILRCVRWYLRYPTRLPRSGGHDARARLAHSVSGSVSFQKWSLEYARAYYRRGRTLSATSIQPSLSQPVEVFRQVQVELKTGSQ
jgi:hypothetical protein